MKKILILSLTFLLSLGSSLFLFVPIVSANTDGMNIIITEVLYDTGMSLDPDAYQWIELYNPTDSSIVMSNWVIESLSTTTLPFSGTVAPHDFFVLAVSSTLFQERYGFLPDIDLSGLVLGISMDEVSLKDDTASVVDYMGWGEASSGWSGGVSPGIGDSLCRGTAIDTDLSDDFFSCNTYISPSLGPDAGDYTVSLPTSVSEAPGGLTSLLDRWFDGDREVYQDMSGVAPAVHGNSVELWRDLGSYGYDALMGASGTSPLYKEYVMNGHHALLLGFSPDTSLEAPSTDLVSDYSLFTVLYPQSIGSLQRIWGEYTDDLEQQMGLYLLPSGQIEFVYETGDNNMSVQSTSSLGDEPVFIEVSVDSGDTISLRINGVPEGEAIAPITVLNGGDLFMFGFNPYQGVDSFNGYLSEFISYNTKLSDIENKKVASYLGLKYGLTLSPLTVSDYLASDGSVMWNSALSDGNVFVSDIFGIGRDDVSHLSQVSSRSVAPDAIISIGAMGEGSSVAPSFVDMDDLEFLTIANNNGTPTWVNTNTAPGFQRLDRIWKTQEYGDLGDLSFELNVDNEIFNVPDALDEGIYYLLVDENNNNDFTDETHTYPLVDAGAGVWTYDGINLQHGMKFTVATAFTPSTLLTVDSHSMDEMVPSEILLSGGCNIAYPVLVSSSLFVTGVTSTPCRTVGYDLPLLFSVGDHMNPITFDLAQYDTFGTQVASTSIRLIPDVVAPMIPTVNSLSTENIQPTITGTYEMGSMLEITIDDMAYYLGDSLGFDAVGGDWTLSLSTAGQSLAVGIYDVFVKTTDDVGNSSIDETVDEISILAPPVVVPLPVSAPVSGGGGVFPLLVQPTPGAPQSPTCQLSERMISIFFVGDRSLEVTALQSYLACLGHLETSDISGVFDLSTTEGLMAYQKEEGISPTGYIGPQTRERLNQSYSVEVFPRVNPYACELKNDLSDVFLFGESSPQVTAVGEYLQCLGYIDVVPTSYDGIFEYAVKRFQEHHGLEGTGYIGPWTRSLLLQ